MERQKVIFFTGAGISVDSGIPTFQEQPGIREKLTRDFANNHPEEYREVIKTMMDACEKAEPNAAHLAIAKTGFPVITMNVDRLHSKAGSESVIEVHGKLPTREEIKKEDFPLTYNGIVLYGDLAPEYVTAERLVKSLEYANSFFVIVGTSFYTSISERLKHLATQRHAKIVIINEKASERVPEICERLMAITGKTTDRCQENAHDHERI